MIRATTGGVMKTYRSNLMNSFINMNKGMNTILSQRTFNSFAEDPAAAAKTFRLRKSRMMVESQYAICTDVHKKYETGVACLQSIDDVLCTKEGEYGYYMKTLTGTTLKMLNDPEGDAREQLTKVLDQMSQQIIQTMNQKYADNFIFAGADGHNVPFEIKDNKLYYRGVPVDASMPEAWQDKNGLIVVAPVSDGSGNYYVVGNTTGADGELYLKPGNMKTISVAEYNELYNNVPKVKMTTTPPTLEGDPDYPSTPSYPDGDQVPVEYNSDGTERTHVDDEGGWYRLLNDDGTEGELISKQEYHEAVYRQNHSPARLLNGDGSGRLVDADGNPTDDGEYYIIFEGEPQTMTKEEYEQQKLDWEKLQYLARETSFVDIGYGFQEDPVTGRLIESSAFNSALNGINFLGWGLDDDGDPKNIYSLVQKMREVAESVDSGTDWTTSTWDEFDRLVDKFEVAVSNYQTEFVNLDASTGKLSNQVELLEDNFDNLVEQYSDIEDVDMAEAITSFLWAQYAYNAALRVGNSVLSQSLMDYLS